MVVVFEDKKLLDKLLSWVVTGKKRLGRILCTLFIISLWVFLSASTENVISIFSSPEVSWFFINRITGNEIAFNLSLGFIVSSIFYFFVAYLPEERRKRHLKPIVKKRLESTLETLHSLFACLLEYSSTETELNTLTEADFKDICNTFLVKKDLNKGVLGSSEFPVEGVYYSSTPGVILANRWFQSVDKINYLGEVLPIFNDEELTAILLELEIQPLSTVMRTVVTSESTDLCSYESVLMHVFKITQKLSKYHKKNIDPNYVEQLIISSNETNFRTSLTKHLRVIPNAWHFFLHR